MSELYHGKFKYIDKWKSKSGKWVYKYIEDKKKKDLHQTTANIGFNLLGFGANGSNSGVHITAHNSQKPSNSTNKPSGRKKISSAYNSGQWHNSGYSATIRGDDQTRVRITTNDRGQTVRRREYRSEAENRNLNKQEAQYNAAYKDAYSRAFGPLASFVMDFNDKHGPKSLKTIEYETADGKRYVETHVVNSIGGRSMHVEAYSYDPNEDHVMRRKKKNRKKFANSKLRQVRKPS